jgi:CRP-like cAMP-binding protein
MASARAAGPDRRRPGSGLPGRQLSESHLEDIQRKGQLRTLDKGKILFKRGASDGHLVWLLQGSVDLADENFEITPRRSGEPEAKKALDGQQPHSVTAVTTTPARVFVVPKDYVDLVLTWDEAGSYMVTELTDDEESDEGDWMSSLLSSAMFAAVPPANIQQLFAKFEEVRIPADEAVIRQGDPGDYFYAVKSGRCRITRRISQGGEVKEVPLAELGPGDVFGEDALIGDAPRNATVTMITEGALMRLNQDDFESLLQNPVLEYIEFDEWRALKDGGETAIDLLDVRLPAEFKAGHLDDARNLPLHVIRQNLGKLDEATIYVLACDGGRRSILASYILSQEGYDARVLKDPPANESSAA